MPKQDGQNRLNFLIHLVNWPSIDFVVRAAMKRMHYWTVGAKKKPNAETEWPKSSKLPNTFD